MAQALQIAVIGCGWAGTRHARAFAQSGAVVRWAVDLDPARAQALAEGLAARQEVHIATDYHEVLGDRDVEAVAICLPHNLHAPVAVEAAQAGKHVLCEKPIADTLDAADWMIAAAETAGVTLMIAENERFNPLYHKVRELLDRGAIGRPALVQRTRECYLTRSFIEDRPWFLDARAAAGGMMMAGGVHDFETMRMLLGEVASVYALRAPQRFVELEGDDTSVALVRFCSGAVGTLVLSFVMKSLATAAGPEVHTLRIDGDLGSLSVTDGQTIHLYTEQGEPFLGERLAQHDIVVPPQDTFLLEVAHFIHCIQHGEETLTSGRAQRRPLECVLAAYRSMATGQAVALS
jgi:UDP-N-acetyl-2-amino-2-deoxyglucuronate dehydrogenase